MRLQLRERFIEVHRLTHQQFPRFERYQLGSQMWRAAYSVAANVVEGSARRSWRERLNFFNIASSSLSEVTHGVHAVRLGYITPESRVGLDKMARMVAGPLHGLIRYERGLLERAEHVETK